MREIIRRPNILPSPFSDDVPEIVSAFLAYQDVKQSSKDTYRRQLIQFLRYLTENRINNPTRETILAFKAALIKKGLSGLTVNSYLVVVRKFFAYLERMGYYPNIAKDIKGCSRASFFMKDPLTVDQIEQLLGSILRESVIGKRDYAILNLMVRAGLRSIEIVRANVGDIRQYGDEALLYVQGKGKDAKDEFVLLTEKALNPILDYLSTRNNTRLSSPLFTSESNRNSGGRLTTRTIRGLVKKHLRGIGLDDSRLSAHSLRHTFATMALSSGAPVTIVKEAMRHKDVSTTMVYVHLMNRLKNAAERYIDF